MIGWRTLRGGLGGDEVMESLVSMLGHPGKWGLEWNGGEGMISHDIDHE